MMYVKSCAGVVNSFPNNTKCVHSKPKNRIAEYILVARIHTELIESNDLLKEVDGGKQRNLI